MCELFVLFPKLNVYSFYFGLGGEPGAVRAHVAFPFGEGRKRESR